MQCEGPEPQLLENKESAGSAHLVATEKKRAQGPESPAPSVLREAQTMKVQLQELIEYLVLKYPQYKGKSSLINEVLNEICTILPGKLVEESQPDTKEKPKGQSSTQQRMSSLTQLRAKL